MNKTTTYYNLSFVLLEQVTDYLNKNSLIFFFSKIYGIKESKITLVLKKLGFSTNIKIKQITPSKFFFCSFFFNDEGKSNNSYKIDRYLKKKNIFNLNIYKARRLKRKLPVRGQRTRCNARTAKYLH